MKNLFIITASNAEAKQHLQDTIANQIPAEKVEKHFISDELSIVKEIGASEGYYAWGARPTEGNIGTWSRIQPGDFILTYQEGHYTFFSEVLYKTINKEFAELNWGKSKEGDTWDHIYFLKHPQKIDPPLKAIDVADYLPSRLMGFTRISDKKVGKIIENFSNLETFFMKHFPGLIIEKSHSLGFWWVNQGKSFTPDKGQKYIWAPKSGKGGVRPKYWRDMEIVQKGDMIFNYAKGALRGISIASEKGYDYFDKESEDWDKNGIRINFEHYPINPIEIEQLKTIYTGIIESLGDKVGPFDKNGDIKQGYLFEFSLGAARLIRNLYGKPFPEPIESLLKGDYSTPEKKNIVIILLAKKGQIILYGPPGTGKTFITRKLAVEFINNIDMGQKDEDLPDYPGDEAAGKIESELHNKLTQFVESIRGTKKVPRKSMTGYYSISRLSKRETGLIWISSGIYKSGAFKVWVRKPVKSPYPSGITSMLHQYKENGWGGYPEILVDNDQDVENIMKMIQYAHDEF